MKLALRNRDHVAFRMTWRMQLAFVAIQFLLFSGFALPGAYAGGGDLKRPAATDSPQPGKQEAKASVVDSVGNLIVTGYQNLAGGIDDDYLTVKFNANGTVAWRKTYNRLGGSDQATAIVVDSSDNVIVSGFAWNGTNYDIYTVKYRGSDGVMLWEHTYDAPAHGNDIAASIAVDTLNNVYVGGYVQNVAGNEDYIILKYSVSGPNTDGTPVWVATWNGVANGVDKLASIAAGVGGVAVTGQSWNGTDFDVMTIKYDYNGAKLWECRYTSPGANLDAGRKVAIDGSGNVIITAAVTNSGNLDIYTAKYAAANGALIWGSTYNSPTNNDEPYGLALDSSGNAYVTGYTFTLTGHEDLLVIRYRASDGLEEWKKIYDSGASAADIGTGIVLDTAGNVYVTGYSVVVGGNTNILTLKIKNDSISPTLYWASTFDGVAHKNEKPVGIGLGASGEVIIGGWTDLWTAGASDYDYLILVYDPGLLNPPSGLSATTLSDTSVKIDWIDNSLNEDGFKIDRKLTELGVWGEVGTVGANITTFTDTGLTPSSTYYYRARSFNAANGSSNPSEEIRVLTLFVTYKAPDWSYLYNSADNKDDFPAAIAVGPDNNPVITGYSFLTLGGFDYYTIKLNNSTGALLWSHLYDDADSEIDRATSVAVDSANAAIVTGYSSLYYAPAIKNVNSIYTMKFPASCSPPTPCTPVHMWHSQYNGPGGVDDRATAIASAIDSSDSVVIVGYGKNAALNEDIYLIKYAAAPAVDGFGKAIPEWSATPYDSVFHGNDFPDAVAFDKDGNVFVAGHVQSASLPDRYKTFVAKYCGKAGAPCNGKTPGQIIWEDSFSGSGDNQARSLAIDKDGNPYVAGFDTGLNGRDILLIKYDGKAVPTGSRVLWSRTVDGAAHGDDSAISVKYDQIDDSVVVGGTVLTAVSDRDFIIIRYDSAGTEKWRKIHLRPGTDEEALGMAMDVSGNVSIVGYTGNGLTTDALSVKYGYDGSLLAATIYNGAANSFDEATAVTFNSLGDTLVAGYTTNATGNADYLVYSGKGSALQASSPFTASPFYTKVDLAWADTSTGETGFYIERKPGTCASANPWVLIYTAAANATTYSDTGLNIGQEYCYRVRSFKAGEIDPRWIERYALLTSPMPPGNVTATPVNTTQINLAWLDNTTGETGFRIFRCTGAGCINFTEIGSVLENVVTYSDTTVAAGTSYSYKILSYKTADWQSAFSLSASAITPSPATPSGLTATRASEGQINLSWTDTNNDETGFKIERCEVALCTFSQIDTVLANVTTYNDIITLKPDTAYRYRVRAYKTATIGWDSPYSATADATTTLATTSGLTATAGNTTTINLSWIDNTGTETGFKIERCPSGSCLEADFVEAAQTVSNTTTWSDTSVCNGSTYTYRVRALNAGISMGGGGVWTRRKPLTITNFLPNFQTKVTIPYDVDMKANFDDIRFYDETNKREIPYYLESKTDSSTATVWIKTGAFNTISLYFGNASALSASNGAAVYEFFDSFTGTVIDTAKWTKVGSYYTQNNELISSGGSGAWDSGMFSIANFARPFVYEVDFYPTGGVQLMIGAKNTGAGISYTEFTYAAYAVNDINGNRLLVYEDGVGRGDNLKAITSNVWQYYKVEVLATGAKYYHGLSPTAYTNYYTSAYSNAPLLKVGFTNVDKVFKLDNARVRKYAAAEPSVLFGVTETSTGYTFVNTWIGLPSATASVTTPTPTAPTGPLATRVNEAQINLAWTDTTSDETGFRIERCKGAACVDFVEIGTVGAGVVSYSDTSPLDVNTTYRYQVRAYKTATCGGGWNGPYSSIASATTTLMAPSALTAALSVSTTCDDLRFTESDGTTLLNYWVESGCGTVSTKVWLKLPTLPAGPRSLYLYWANPTASAMSSGTATFDFFDDFTGTTIDTGKWVKADNGAYLSQNNEIIATGGSGVWGSNTMYSVANFARPFVLELKHKQTAGSYMMFGAKDTSASTTYGYYHYAAYPVIGTILQVYESGSYRGTNLAPIASNVWEYYKFEVLGTGAKYYVGTSPAAYTLFYDSVYSTASPLKIGFDNDNQAFSMDDVRVRKYATPLPTFTVGAFETAAYSLTGGTWNARRPLTITNGGTALIDYQTDLTIDTTVVASDRISLAWTDNTSSETGFIVERCAGAACDFTTITTFSAAANATSFVDKTVAMATTYCYRVKAEKSLVWTSTPSNSACVTTTTIAAPVLTATATTKIDLSWTDTTTGEDGFAVERCTGVSCDFTVIDSGFPVTLNPNVTTYADNAVCANSYRYRVKPFKSGPSGWSIYSNIANAATILPVAPSGLSATRISEIQINLAWTDNTTDETGFKVERCQGTGCSVFTLVADLPANTTTYSDNGRAPDITYRYRVRAYKGGGCAWETANSNEVEATASLVAPSALTAATTFSTQVDLAWTDNTITETAFKIERCLTALCTYAPLATLGANVTSFSDASVCSGTGYTYRLNAVNEGSTNGGGGTWTRRKPVTFTNFQPNFLVRVTVAYDALMKPNFDDIRFVDTINGIELPYWIESKTDSTTANVWIKTSGSSSVYLYFGNGLATSSSSVISIFGPGLMTYYPFNEADGTISGTTADVVGGAGNNLTLTGFTAGYGVKAGGVYGNALSLSGANAAISAAPTVPAGSVASIEAWIYPKAYADVTYNGIVSWGTRTALNALALSIQNSGRLSMPTWANDFVPASGVTATLNAWNHVVAVLNGTSFTLYTNGQLVGTTILSAPNIPSINLAIGALEYPGGRYFNGLIDEVRIYNRALTATEIAGRYATLIPSATLGANEIISTTNTYGWTYATSYVTATATPPALAAPTAFTATRAHESQINLAWIDGVTGETGFEIDRCVGAACDFTTKITIQVAANTTSYVDVGLLPDTTYRYQIRAKRVATCTAYSSYATVAQAVTTLIAPSALTATAPNTTQLNLSWTDTTGSETGFKVERCTGSGCTTGFSQIGITGPSINTYVDTTVCPSTAYGYRVAAVNAGLSYDGGGCWTRRKPITITNFQPDFQTKVTIAYVSTMKADFSDIRFHDPVANQELPYWFESKTNSSTATVWVKTRVSSTIYLYYGNATATSVDSGASTFEFFDDFTGTTIDAAKWTTVGPYYTQNNELISSGGSGAWNSGMYSVANFARPFVYEVDFYRTGGGSMMLGAKNTGAGISYIDFTYAGYVVYGGGGALDRLLVYEDGAGRADNLKLITSNVWQYYKLEVLPTTGAIYYQGLSPAAYTSYYTSAYSSASPLKVGFTNADEVFKLDNARVRKYASPEPATVVGTEELSACFAFTGTYISGYSNVAPGTTPTPAAPATLTAIATNDTNINLAWSDLSNDETVFRIERCAGVSCSAFLELTTVPANTTSYSSAALTPSTTYCYRVRADKTATCATGWPTAYTNTACAKAFPAQVATFSATAVGPFMVRLDWIDSAIDEDGYEIEVMAWNGKWVNIATTLPNVITYLDRVGINPLKTYTYRIRPFRGSDKSPYKTTNTVTTPAYSPGAATCP
ncbi:MAG TPA: DUF2341 domain-containing protein [Desulfuromonadaceae bacterium]